MCHFEDHMGNLQRHMALLEVDTGLFNVQTGHSVVHMGILGICSGYFVFKVFILRFM